MEHLVNLFPLKLDDIHLSDITEHGLFTAVRNKWTGMCVITKCPRDLVQAHSDKLSPICGHCLPSSHMMPPAYPPPLLC